MQLIHVTESDDNHSTVLFLGCSQEKVIAEFGCFKNWYERPHDTFHLITVEGLVPPSLYLIQCFYRASEILKVGLLSNLTYSWVCFQVVQYGDCLPAIHLTHLNTPVSSYCTPRS